MGFRRPGGFLVLSGQQAPPVNKGGDEQSYEEQETESDSYFKPAMREHPSRHPGFFHPPAHAAAAITQGLSSDPLPVFGEAFPATFRQRRRLQRCPQARMLAPIDVRIDKRVAGSLRSGFGHGEIPIARSGRSRLAGGRPVRNPLLELIRTRHGRRRSGGPAHETI